MTTSSSLRTLFTTGLVAVSLVSIGCDGGTEPCNSDADCTVEGEVCRIDPDTSEQTCGEPLAPVQQRVRIASFTASPSPIDVGATSTLTWESESADSCELTNSVTDAAIDVELSGTTDVTPTENTTYTITCENSVNVASDVATVVVNRPVAIISFTATQTEIDFNTTVTLSWESENATRCSLGDGGETNDVDATSNLNVEPGETTTYTLECTGFPQPVTATVTVTVARIAALDVDTVLFAPPASLAFTWTVDNVTNCVLSGPAAVTFADVTPLSSTATVADAGAFDFTVTCDGFGGPLSATRGVFGAAVTSFDVTPNPVASGETVTATWVAAEVDGCELQRVVDGADNTVLQAGLVASGNTTVENVTEAQSLVLSCTRSLGADVLTVTSAEVALALQ